MSELKVTAMPPPRAPMIAYRQPVDEVVAALGTDARRGLSDGEARVRLGRRGRNKLTAGKTIPAWRKFLTQFQDVLAAGATRTTPVYASPELSNVPAYSVAAPLPPRGLAAPARADGWGSEFKGAFDEAWQALGIHHTRTKPRHAWTNGFVERLQGTIL